MFADGVIDRSNLKRMYNKHLQDNPSDVERYHAQPGSPPSLPQSSSKRRKAASEALDKMRIEAIANMRTELREAEVRVAIKVMYVKIMGCPDPCEWYGPGGTIEQIEMCFTPKLAHPWGCRSPQGRQQAVLGRETGRLDR